MAAKAQLRLLVHLARGELARRHSGAAGGRAWAFILPLVGILVVWVALDQALGLGRLIGPAYGQSLVVGLLAWQFVSEAVATGLGAIASQPHLVKKVAFPVALLPMSHVVAGLAVHVVVVAIIVAVLGLAGVTPGWTILALPFWILAACVLAGALALIVASLNVVARDTAAVVPALIGLWFWLTPIVWPLDANPGPLRTIALANPMTAIVVGYRQALLGEAIPIETPLLALVTGGVIVLAGLGLLAFRRLRPIFADSL